MSCEKSKVNYFVATLCMSKGIVRIFMGYIGAITFALILQKFRLRLSYTCTHKSGAFALRFGVTLAPIFSQLFLGQLLVFEVQVFFTHRHKCTVFESLSLF